MKKKKIQNIHVVTLQRNGVWICGTDLLMMQWLLKGKTLGNHKFDTHRKLKVVSQQSVVTQLDQK